MQLNDLPMQAHPDAWWAVALSESVTRARPHATVCDGVELVLFRDAAGHPRALHDRCPHRRVPLSLGVIKGDRLQCGYHGWTFDGASGKCTEIPNLRADEPVPAHYAAQAFAVAEANGFVLVRLGAPALAGVARATLPGAGYSAVGREFTGSTVVAIGHDECLAVLLDGPQCLIDFDFVRITDFFLGDAQLRDGRVVLDRGAVWGNQFLPSQFVADYPLIVRSSVDVVGGAARIELLTDAEQPLVTVQLATGANRRGTTSVCWRGFNHPAAGAGPLHAPLRAPLRWRARRALGRAPFQIHANVDAAALAALLVGPSRELMAARAQVASLPLPVPLPLQQSRSKTVPIFPVV